jgi:hypothetical protein
MSVPACPVDRVAAKPAVDDVVLIAALECLVTCPARDVVVAVPSQQDARRVPAGDDVRPTPAVEHERDGRVAAEVVGALAADDALDVDLADGVPRARGAVIGRPGICASRAQRNRHAVGAAGVADPVGAAAARDDIAAETARQDVVGERPRDAVVARPAVHRDGNVGRRAASEDSAVLIRQQAVVTAAEPDVEGGRSVETRPAEPKPLHHLDASRPKICDRFVAVADVVARHGLDDVDVVCGRIAVRFRVDHR